MKRLVSDGLVQPRGKVNLVTVILLAALAGGIWAIVLFSPAVLDNLDVKEAIAAAYAQSATLSDEDIFKLLDERTRRVGTHVEDDAFGQPRVVPGLGLKRENLLIARDTVANTIDIQVRYTREVQLRPTARVHRLQFSPRKSGPVPPR